MSRTGRVLSICVAIGTGVISGVYIFQPLIVEERNRQLAEATPRGASPATNNAPPNLTPGTTPNTYSSTPQDIKNSATPNSTAK
ncbi:hypothetical protein BDV93DRAFT_56026 [Ceratobasidium sp. AG-I]|nr:hypothetical protein BDV93DRAFT_56026 [Ceratobasidium sp. AG-I]